MNTAHLPDPHPIMNPPPEPVAGPEAAPEQAQAA